MGGLSYQDVKELPTDVLELWMAFRLGENDTRREQVKKSQDRVVTV